MKPAFHTRFEAAIIDPSTWAGFAAVVTGATALDGWPRVLAILCGCVAVVLKNLPPVAAE